MKTNGVLILIALSCAALSWGAQTKRVLTADACPLPTGATFLTGGRCATPDVQRETGPFFAGDVHAAIDQATKDGKVVVMSLGRRKCPRCLKFYALQERGQLTFDPAKCVYLKLLVDDLDHKETFLSFCAPEDGRLPYLGVYNPATGETSCRTAGGTLDECREFFKDVLYCPKRVNDRGRKQI